jgi:hypothetical protein
LWKAPDDISFFSSNGAHRGLFRGFGFWCA